MKKLFVCLLSLLMLVGCSSKTEETTTTAEETKTEETTTEQATTDTTLVNPVVEVASLEEINEKLGCAMTTPGVAGSENVSYSIIDDKIGQYVFTVNGNEYTYRFENDTTDDISGIYGSDGAIFKTTDDTYYEDNDYKVTRWFNIDGQYCLAVNDKGSMEKDTFLGIADEFETYTTENMVNQNSDK